MASDGYHRGYVSFAHFLLYFVKQFFINERPQEKTWGFLHMGKQRQISCAVIDHTILLLSKFEISSLEASSVAMQTGVLDLIRNPEDRFLSY